jgi:hypothetical protein
MCTTCVLGTEDMVFTVTVLSQVCGVGAVVAASAGVTVRSAHSAASEERKVFIGERMKRKILYN